MADEVTRDFAYGELDPLVRTCRLMPWQPADISHISAEVSEPPIGYFEVNRLTAVISLLFGCVLQCGDAVNDKFWKSRNEEHLG